MLKNSLGLVRRSCLRASPELDEGTNEGLLKRTALDQFFIAEAPVVIVVVSDTRRSKARYGERGEKFSSIIDGAFAALLVLLAAVNEGLGAAFVGAFDDDEVWALLGLPKAVRQIGRAHV